MPTVDKRALGVRLRTLRKAKSLSQSKLADKSGVASVTIQDIEKGEANPTIETLQSLGDALGLPLIQIYGQGVNLDDLTDFRESLVDLSEGKQTPNAIVLKALVEHPQNGDSLSVASLLLGRFLNVPVKARALVLFLLYGDKAGALRPYLKGSADLLPKPK